MNQDTQVLFIGDVHGEFTKLFARINTLEIRDCIMICVGDLGIGFHGSHEKQLRQFEYLNKFFVSKNIQFLSIRGNHDDPAYWGLGEAYEDVSFSHFKLIHDYDTQIINEEKFLFVGGAISIDRRVRKEGISYWNMEKFHLDISRIEKCDVLVTHTGPSWIGPFDKSDIQTWVDKDPTLWDECKEERKQMDMLYKLSQPKKSYLGHFHTYQGVEFGGCYATLLGIRQIVEHRKT